MRKLLIALFVALVALPLATFSTTIYFTPAKIIVYADNYPDQDSVTYYVTLKNLNDFPVLVHLERSTTIVNYVTILENDFILEVGETKQVALEISLQTPSYVYGTIDIEFTRADGESYPVTGTVEITIHGRGTGPTQRCAGTTKSCGTWPDCQDLTELNGCYNGYYRKYYCSNNEPKYTEYCTDYCCKQYFGSEGVCRNRVCVGPPKRNITVSIVVTNGTVERNVHITVYTPGKKEKIVSVNVSGTVQVSCPNATVDFEMKFDNGNLNILIKNLNLTKLVGDRERPTIIIDKVVPQVSFDTLRAYRIELSHHFSHKGIVMRVKYDDLSVQGTLVLYKCSDYNFEMNRCNVEWVKIPVTLENGFVKAELSSFSVYVLAEEEEATTTTTTTTVPSGGGGSSSTQTSTSSSSGGGSVIEEDTTTTTQPELTCSDEDELDFETKGTCEIDGVSYTDYCADEVTLKEFYCSDSDCETMEKDCQEYCQERGNYNGSCINGACVCEEVTTTTTETVEETEEITTGSFLDVIGSETMNLLIVTSVASAIVLFVLWKYQLLSLLK